MRRFSLSLIAIVTGLFFLSACGKNNTIEKNTAEDKMLDATDMSVVTESLYQDADDTLAAILKAAKKKDFKESMTYFSKELSEKMKKMKTEENMSEAEIGEIYFDKINTVKDAQVADFTKRVKKGKTDYRKGKMTIQLFREGTDWKLGEYDH